MRPHDAVKMALSKVLHRAGAAVDVERVIPELADSVWDHQADFWKDRFARMDVTAMWPGCTTQWWVDVSVRCPTAKRYTASPEGAAEKGEQEKRTRYNDAVRPVVFESWSDWASARCSLCRN